MFDDFHDFKQQLSYLNPELAKNTMDSHSASMNTSR